jgi:hypothetical protein
MTPRELLTMAYAVGILVEAHAGRLIVDAPIGALTPGLRSAFTAHRPALIEVLWRLKEMRRLVVTEPRAVVYARVEACGGPGHCFSCGDPHEHPDAYGRCGPCDIASDLYYATRHADGAVEVVA